MRWLFSFHGRLRHHKAEAIFFLGVLFFFFRISQLTVSINYYVSNDGVRRREREGDASYPIYIIADIISREKFKVLDWSVLSSRWSSNSSYADFLEYSQSVNMDTIIPSSNDHRRIIIILHNHPKMASTTLRRACWENLKSSCNVVSTSRDPMGYSNANDLATLMEQCRNTYHFCVGGWHYGADNFPNATNRSTSSSFSSLAIPITFVHMFPFRNFNEWAESALKQIFVGHSDAGCREACKRLDSCNGWLELDFEKYSKRTMASMIDIMNVRDNELWNHIFFLYDYRTVQTTLTLMSHAFHTPMLSYLDMTYKQNRREGSCPTESLQKFHDCFDKQLLTDIT